MKILIVSAVPTHPITEGNRSWIVGQNEILTKLGHEVHFLWIRMHSYKQLRLEVMRNYRETHAYWGSKFYEFRPNVFVRLRILILNVVRKKICGWVWKCDDIYPYGVEKYVRKLNEVERFDVMFVHYFYLSKLLPQIDIPLKALVTHDCFTYKNDSLNMRCYLNLTPNEEAKALQRSHHVFALQSIEQHYFQKLSPQSIVYDVYCNYKYHPSPVIGNHSILFLSGSNQFNINGFNWFIKEIWPEIKAKFSDVELHIAGSICQHLNLDDSHVFLHGFVSNPEDFYNLGDIAINPTFQGTGLKIKTFEAISFDKITMVHPHSTDGIFEPSRAPLFFSERPEDWICFLEEIWNDKSLISNFKKENKEYLNELNNFIINQYRSFLNK